MRPATSKSSMRCSRRRPDLRIIVRTSAPKWLFDLTVKVDRASRLKSTYHHLETDTGIAQIDSLHLDADETVRRARAFMDGFDERVTEAKSPSSGQRRCRSRRRRHSAARHRRCDAAGIPSSRSATSRGTGFTRRTLAPRTLVESIGGHYRERRARAAAADARRLFDIHDDSSICPSSRDARARPGRDPAAMGFPLDERSCWSRLAATAWMAWISMR